MSEGYDSNYLSTTKTNVNKNNDEAPYKSIVSDIELTIDHDKVVIAELTDKLYFVRNMAMSPTENKSYDSEEVKVFNSPLEETLYNILLSLKRNNRVLVDLLSNIEL